MKHAHAIAGLALAVSGCADLEPVSVADSDAVGPVVATDVSGDMGYPDHDASTDLGLPAPVAADADADGYDETVDCDDADPTAFPGGWERCDGVDNDCSGAADDGLPLGWWYRDADGDGFGDASGPSFEACGAPDGWVTDALDCDDALGRVSPDALELCDGLDNDCDGAVDEACTACAATLFPGDVVQDALDAAADGDLICLEPGTYVENLVFPPTELHLLGVDGPAATTIEAAVADSVVIVDVPVGLGAVIEGLTLTGGQALTGGGVAVQSASPTLRRLVVEGNRAAEAGGGLYLRDFDGELVDVQVRDNHLTAPSAFGGGGGVLLDASRASVRGLVAERNTAPGASGGGVRVFISDVTLDGLTVQGNVARDGGGLSIYESNATITAFRAIGNVATSAGGGVQTTTVAFPTFDHALIAGNVARQGGGVYSGGSDLATWRHTLIVENRAPTAAAMYISSGTAVLEQSAIVGNRSDGSRGALYAWSSYVTLDNVVISHNRSSGPYGGVDVAGYTSFLAANTDIWGNSPADIAPGIFYPSSDGNVATDPLFVAVDARHFSAWDVHLQPGSPLVDAGSEADPDGSPGDIGVFGGAGADQRDLDGDGDPSWWAPGPFDPLTSPGADCRDLDDQLGAAACGA